MRTPAFVVPGEVLLSGGGSLLSGEVGGYCCQGGSAVGGDLLPGGRGHSHVNRMTHACKNITFQQLHWRAVITQNRNPLNTLLEAK